MVLRSVHTCVSLHCMCQHLHITLFSLILSFHLSLIPLNRFHLGDVNFCLEQIQMPIRHTTVNWNSQHLIDEPRAFYSSWSFRYTNVIIEKKWDIRWTKVEDKFHSLDLGNFLTIKKEKEKKKEYYLVRDDGKNAREVEQYAKVKICESIVKWLNLKVIYSNHRKNKIYPEKHLETSECKSSANSLKT